MVEAEAILFFIMGKSRGFGNQEKVSWLLIPDWLVGQAYHFLHFVGFANKTVAALS